MSGALAIAIAAATAGELHVDEPLRNAISVALPSLDGMHGLAAAYERYAPERGISFVASAQLRQSVAGDFTGLRLGGGGELRWYWLAHSKAWLSKLPAGSMAGWFAGVRADVAIVATHDDVDARWLGNTIEVSSALVIGYRIVPWRQLEITPSLNAGVRHELADRVPGWTRPTIGAGLTAGWLF
ncbi:MAG: hypothetical protein ABI867_37710 [Kofleriaceae bacterium]